MRGVASGVLGTVRARCLAGAAALACAIAIGTTLVPALAQMGTLDAGVAPDGSQMLLESDTLVYDNDRNTVTAVGGVQIEYGGNRLVAERVTYDRATARLTASGDVEILEEDGNRIYADSIDVTDDFADGFVNALRVEAVDDTYFAAESAERVDDRMTTFNSGLYTACEPCEENPDKPVTWNIKAQKIIRNGETRTVRFENAHFELFGLPIAYLPFFEMADPTVKRKSGFLFPSIMQDSDLGWGVKVPYYFALSPTYDLTVSVTPYSRQGFLGEAEWRQQFDNGQYSLKIAGISQQDSGAWNNNRVNGSVDDRAMIGSKGRFDINPRWTFGWDVMAQTDKNFSYTYDIAGFNEREERSEVYLEGFNDRNYFDLRAMRFHIQEDLRSDHERSRHETQPWVLPMLDYAYTHDEPVHGGELSIDVNAQSLHRDQLQRTTEGILPGEESADGSPASLTGDRIRGPQGSSGRLTAEAEWKRSMVSSGGLVVTPLLHARGDAIYSDLSSDTVDGINDFQAGGSTIDSDVRSAYHRYMATAGLEVRWPVLFSTSSSTHVLEPMAQLFLRPDEPYGSSLGIPNEDAQSLVFDATTLFEREKFSGYDRIEGGTRANLGIRYSGSFGDGWTANAVVGQSYHLAGRNPYDSPDLVNAGAYSGLESDVSDFVGLLGLTSPVGVSGSVGARLDEETFELRRTDVNAGYNTNTFSLALQYAYIQGQPLYGFVEDNQGFENRHEVSAGASVNLRENWQVFGSTTFDIESSTMTKNSFGLAYDDECFIYSMTYSQSRNRVTDEVDQSIGFTISLRTLGEFGSDTGRMSDS